MGSRKKVPQVVAFLPKLLYETKTVTCGSGCLPHQQLETCVLGHSMGFVGS